MKLAEQTANAVFAEYAVFRSVCMKRGLDGYTGDASFWEDG